MKKVGIAILIILLILGVICCKGYYTVWGNNLNPNVENPLLYIPNGSDMNTVMDSLSTNQLLNNLNDFELTAKLMKYGDKSVKPGRYDLTGLVSNRSVISKLRIGDQDPIDIIVNGGRTIDKVIDNIANQMTFSSDDLRNVLLSPENLTSWDADIQTIISKIPPDTYEMYWNASPNELIKRLRKEYQNYWNTDRLAQASAKGLSPDQVMTLASIVEKETNQVEEYSVIAGVYLNRLKRGMLLQADPTVVFANGDFNIRRVLNKHLRKDSPYNTYMYAGLPPGPICLPSKGAINGVLNPQKHQLLYFCAQPNYSGKHDFSKNLKQHNKYANIYRRWLSSQGIRG